MPRTYLLLTDIEKARFAADEKSVNTKWKLYHELIREYINVQEDFCELLTRVRRGSLFDLKKGKN
jgi:hypothetical protein